MTNNNLWNTFSLSLSKYRIGLDRRLLYVMYEPATYWLEIDHRVKIFCIDAFDIFNWNVQCACRFDVDVINACLLPRIIIS